MDSARILRSLAIQGRQFWIVTVAGYWLGRGGNYLELRNLQGVQDPWNRVNPCLGG